MKAGRVSCDHCGKSVSKETGHANRARKLGFGLYCDRRCMGLARRIHRTPAEKIELKRLYDAKRRKALADRIREEKRAYYAANRARILEGMSAYRKTPEYKARMRAYLQEYWKRPGLISDKKDYDRKFRARKQFGPYWEAHYLSVLINEEVLKQTTKYEVRLKNGTLNKAMKRGRDAESKRGYA